MNKKHIAGLTLLATGFIAILINIKQAPQYIQVLAGVIVLPIFAYELIKTHRENKEKDKPLVHYLMTAGSITMLLMAILLLMYFLVIAPIWIIGLFLGVICVLGSSKLLPDIDREFPETNKKYIKTYAVPLVILLVFFLSFTYSSNEKLLKFQSIGLLGFLVLYRAYMIHSNIGDTDE